ncbi:STAS domain-containing protein [Sinomonas mesophila]|uniref:STAS domain-containing protein n=1 Tax=Sinomonas mesophila TaxID=1531955 RepID=UPI0009871714|nr:STAS domain-containing protein [Sinomonas mesophila]
MSFELKIRGDYAILAGPARLNMVSAPKLRTAVAEALRAGHRRLVLDLVATEFMDSTGLGALVACLREARETGGDFRIANAGTQVQMVFELAGMDRLLRAYPSVDAAYGNP